MSRREFTTKTRAAAFHRCEGKCESCGRKLYPGDIHYDHINPDGLTGEPVLENCAVLCRSCHRVKTATVDVPAIARAKRREAKQLGARAPSRNPLPGGRQSPFKKRIDGTVIRREPHP